MLSQTEVVIRLRILSLAHLINLSCFNYEEQGKQVPLQMCKNSFQKKYAVTTKEKKYIPKQLNQQRYLLFLYLIDIIKNLTVTVSTE